MLDMTTMMPMIVFAVIMALAWFGLNAVSNRNSQAEERLARLGRPKSLAEIDISANPTDRKERFSGLKKTIEDLGSSMEPTSDLERNSLKIRLANAGFRSEAAPGIYRGLRIAFLIICAGLAFMYGFFRYGMNTTTLQWLGAGVAVGFYGPTIVLWYLVRKRQQEIFLTLPDALDLLVVCVESGLGLDAAMRKVCDEMKGHAKVICEEFALANLQLQMGRPRREVLHDLGVRTGVDDVRSLAAILIQADRFGSSIAQALRVQSDSMRTRRRQLAEEKAAKTAVQLIFPLVLFIFPGIFVVLVGPAAINISKTLLK
jgi:tight adherence protein C